MKNITPLTIQQEKCCLYLTSGMSLTVIASNLKVNSRTIQRWMEQSIFQNRLRELRKLYLEHSIGKLQRLNDKAIETLERNLNSGNRAAEVRAASTILRLNAEHLELFDFDSRLKKIEESLDLK